jgi:hypothetical protein
LSNWADRGHPAGLFVPKDKKKGSGSMRQLSSFSGSKHISKLGCLWIVGLALSLSLFLSVPDDAAAMEYGTTGPYTVVVESFQNSSGQTTTVLLPGGISGLVPVVYFSHGYGSTSWKGYSALLNHIASQGIAAVYSNYPTSGYSNAQRYQMLWTGFREAASRYSTRFDLNRVGFMGHSYGGGATAAMAYKGLVEQGWGRQGAFLYIMAPYLTFEVSDAQLRSLPTHANLIIQVYSDDSITPHSTAISLYGKLSSIPLQRKAYYYTEGEHSEPSNRSVDDIDRLAIHKPLDALMDYAFGIDRPEEGRLFALEIGGDHYLTTVLKDPNADWSDPINQPTTSTPTDPTDPTQDSGYTGFWKLFFEWRNR